MTAYYVVPETGGGSPAGSGTLLDPWNGYGNVGTLSPGDRLIPVGVFVDETLTIAQSGTEDDRIIIDYTNAESTVTSGNDGIYMLGRSHITIITPKITGEAGAADAGIAVWRSSSITIQDPNISGFADGRGIDVLANNNGNASDLLFEGGTISGNRRGVHLRTATPLSATITDFIIRNMLLSANNEAGVALRSSSGAVQTGELYGLALENNGSSDAAHDSRFGTGVEISGADADNRVLDVNVYDSQSSGTIDNDDDGTDGVGFRADDYCDNINFYRLKSENDQAGIVLKNNNCKAWSFIVDSAAGDGVRYNGLVGNINSEKGEIYNGIVKNCGVGVNQNTQYSDDIRVRNMIVVECTEGFRAHSGATGFTESNNCYWGNTRDFVDESDNALTKTDAKNIDPRLDSNYRPQNKDLIGAGVAVTGIENDYYGNPYRELPSIGPFEMAYRKRRDWFMYEQERRRRNEALRKAARIAILLDDDM